MAPGARSRRLTPPTSIYRCTGALYGPRGDCHKPVVGALVCTAALVPPGGDLEDAEARVAVIPCCADHKRPVMNWAQRTWGSLGEGYFIGAAEIPLAIKELDGPVRVAFDPDLYSQAVKITA